jgi:hypothetical protein
MVAIPELFISKHAIGLDPCFNLCRLPCFNPSELPSSAAFSVRSVGGFSRSFDEPTMPQIFQKTAKKHD